MDIKAKIDELVSKAKSDPNLLEKLKKDPVAAMRATSVWTSPAIRFKRSPRASWLKSSWTTSAASLAVSSAPSKTFVGAGQPAPFFTVVNFFDTKEVLMDYKKLQNGSDIRGVAMDGVAGQAVNRTEQA